MRKLVTDFAAAAFIASFTSAPIPAFAFWIGPFHLGPPSFGHHYHHRHFHTRANPHEVVRHPEALRREAAHGAPPHERPNEMATREVPQEEAGQKAAGQTQHDKAQLEPAWPLLYPMGPLPTMFQNILWGPMPSSMWPLAYESVFFSAFTQTPTEPDQCDQSVNANALIERLRQELGPNTDQTSRLQRLGRAIDTGAGRLVKSCPTEIPHEPNARLQLMLRRIEALTTAIVLIRQPVEDLEESLTQEQQARLAAEAASATAASRRDVKTRILSCTSPSGVVDRSIKQIKKSVQISDEQGTALDDLQQALSRAANDLEAHCSTPVPQSAVARLNSLEARLDASWRAILSIKTALYNFDSKLSADQKNRLKTMTFN